MKNIFLFLALAITMGACGEKKNTADTTDAPAETHEKSAAEKAALGEITYKANCQLCHGADGKLGASGAKDLSASKLNEADALNMVNYGRGGMMGYKDLLTKEQIENVVAYIETLRK